MLIRARKCSPKSWHSVVEGLPHTINVRDRDADVIRVLFKHSDLEHAGFLNQVCCLVCVGIGVCHQLQQDLSAKVERKVSAQAAECRGTVCC